MPHVGQMSVMPYVPWDGIDVAGLMWETKGFFE